MNSPIVFLDIDGVLQHFNTDGWNLDKTACELVESLCERFDAKIVLCSDRAVQQKTCIRQLSAAGIRMKRIVGSCNPHAQPEKGESGKTQRVLDYLQKIPPSTRYVILDDARTFGFHPRLGEHHVLPKGRILQTSDIEAAAEILAPGTVSDAEGETP